MLIYVEVGPDRNSDGMTERDKKSEIKIFQEFYLEKDFKIWTDV